MKGNKKGLQRLAEDKIKKILALPVITPNDIDILNEAEYNELFRLINEKYNQLSGGEREKFLQKIEPIVDNATRNQIWELNHNRIMWAISHLMVANGRMPSKTEIAAKAELSRQTVHKHLTEYSSHPLQAQQLDQFRFMAQKVLAKTFQYAMQGDMAAAKLYLKATGFLDNRQTADSLTIRNQNNYIQINGMVIDQETIKHLNSEQLSTIETILKRALPQKGLQ